MLIDKPSSIISEINKSTGILFGEVNQLTTEWLSPLMRRLDAVKDETAPQPNEKQITDPIWHIIDLEPHEVLLLDSPLMQRLRGIRQLGLAHFVFPGATHDRFSHSLGVLAAVEELYIAVKKITPREEGGRQSSAPQLEQKHRYLLRFAALLHDTGHGPFSHAVEPLLERQYSNEVKQFWLTIKKHAHTDGKPAFAEIVAVLIAISSPMKDLLEHSQFPLKSKCETDNIAELQLQLAIIILGARHSKYPVALSSIISGQVDGDKLDYMARDAHHSGMPIAFDTNRLMSRIDYIRCDMDTLPENDEGNRAFAKQCDDDRYYDIGIKASGVGALEQMLIGRNFLYDRLYFHHKVRAADSMAQRLLEYSLPQNGKTPLKDMYLSISDDSITTLAAGILKGPGSFKESEGSKYLGSALLRRDLYQRAFLFRAHLHHLPKTKNDDPTRARIWSPLSTALENREGREALETAIVKKAQAIVMSSVSDEKLKEFCAELRPWHIIVDLAANRIKPVTIHVTKTTGKLSLPNLTFDPTRWAEVYNLQKRTGYVFCATEHLDVGAFLARIVFCEEFGYVAGDDTDEIIKRHSHRDIEVKWLNDLYKCKLVSEQTYKLLNFQSIARAQPIAENFKLPKEWNEADSEQFCDRLVGTLRAIIPGGFEHDELSAIESAMEGIARFMQNEAHSPALPTTHKPSEPTEMQPILRECFKTKEIDVSEGTELAGGETDLLVHQKTLIENKVMEKCADPLSNKILPRVASQAKRYADALGSKVFFTVIAYQPEQDHVPNPHRQVKVIKRNFEGFGTYAEIRCVVPYGRGIPSKAK